MRRSSVVSPFDASIRRIDGSSIRARDGVYHYACFAFRLEVFIWNLWRAFFLRVRARGKKVYFCACFLVRWHFEMRKRFSNLISKRFSTGGSADGRRASGSSAVGDGASATKNKNGDGQRNAMYSTKRHAWRKMHLRFLLESSKLC